VQDIPVYTGYCDGEDEDEEEGDAEEDAGFVGCWYVLAFFVAVVDGIDRVVMWRVWGWWCARSWTWMCIGEAHVEKFAATSCRSVRVRMWDLCALYMLRLVLLAGRRLGIVKVWLGGSCLSSLHTCSRTDRAEVRSD
jgi:hypothetical protein